MSSVTSVGTIFSTLVKSLRALTGEGVPQRVTYEDVERELDSLSRAINEAIRKDRAEMRDFASLVEFIASPALWTARRYMGERQVSQVRALHSDVASGVRERFGVHARVPEQLRETASEWQDKFQRLAGARREASSLMAVDGWSGDAADGYGSTTAPQLVAIDELAATMMSAVDALYKAANQNQAGFDMAILQIRSAAMKVRGATGGWPTVYGRSHAALQALGALGLAVDGVVRTCDQMAQFTAAVSQKALDGRNKTANGWPKK